ncbi:hypothetical protein HG536_0A06900 [Torulaspora globosa]|uniref:Oxidoreductase-like domain-containing protein n=1 Tax=Torulaspora globosa TaxID=48254 RepID=A0A7G3ZBI9_9SACH|nr:uncharacterized protein HG536_0A06900 [Torulaspora globosa]QLL30875.1 hypothetical protein HG536_0A06900 [Torulaspora globosa]
MPLVLFERCLLATTGRIRFLTSSSRCRMTFEGNTEGLRGTPEERMSTVFGGRLKGEAPTSTSRIVSGGVKVIAGVSVPAKPVEPDNCCMSGCVNCVWEVFSEDIREWKRQRKLAASRIKNTDQVWPANWNPPLSMLCLKNVPESLKTDKIRLDKQAKKAAGQSASLFPERTTPLPKSVIEAKRRNALRHGKAARTAQSEIDGDEEGWQDVPVYIRAFAEFERKKKLAKQQKEGRSGSQ